MVGLYGNILSLITTHHLMSCDICCAKICDTRLTLKTGTSFLSFTSFLLYLYPCFFSISIIFIYYSVSPFYYTSIPFSLFIYISIILIYYSVSPFIVLFPFILFVYIFIIFIYYHVSPFLCLVVGK